MRVRRRIEFSFQFIGELGDVLDVRFLNGNDDEEKVPSHIIVASNDERVKIFDVKTWHCQMLRGHTDIVIGLDVSHDHRLIATCSKVSSRLRPVDRIRHDLCVSSGRRRSSLGI